MPRSVPAARAQLRPLSRWSIVLIGLAILFPAAAMQPAEAEAAGRRSCTGWTSTNVPPKTIRVGRNNGRGPVEQVDFRRYVATVMAKEWPQYLPQAAIEAGAVAVKQYAWYHALAGNHRSSFTAGGSCYDVVDSTRDQIYKPEKVPSIHGNIWRAVDATWGLSVRRAGKFFMTGYRTGTVGRCGANSDGWRLFAKGVIACARQGMSRQAIQERYYGPSPRFVWANGSSQGSSASSSVADEGQPAKEAKQAAPKSKKPPPKAKKAPPANSPQPTAAPASAASTTPGPAATPVVDEMQRERKTTMLSGARFLQLL